MLDPVELHSPGRKQACGQIGYKNFGDVHNLCGERSEGFRRTIM